MTYSDLFFILFGIIDLYIVLIGPIIDMISAKRRVILFVLFFITITVCYHFLSDKSPYLILIILLVFIYFSTNRKVITLCISLFNYLLSIVLNYLALMILELLFGITEFDAATEYGIIYYLFITLLYMISSLLIRCLVCRYFGNHIIIPTSTSLLILTYLIVCTVLFIYNYLYEEALGFSQDVVRVNTILFFLFFTITGIFIIIMMLILRRDAKIQARNAQYESLQQYTEQVENLYLDMRGFKHDYINILSTMQIYMEQEDWENLRTYYENEILPTRNTFQNSSQEIGQLSNLQIPELKSILYNKLVKSLELGLHVHLEIRQPITRIDMKPVDLTRIIGIYLDNAIDALLEIDSESDLPRNLSVACFEHEDATVIIIENTCKDFTLNLHKLGTLSYSTKGKNRGMGLHLATKTLRSYRNVLKETKYKDHVFTQILKIYYT